jgi:uncharacterized membrane protein YedE/YeeE
MGDRIKNQTGGIMSDSIRPGTWKSYAAVSLIGIIGIMAAAAWTRIWVLTALPIGFLFGFFLQKGDLCGASAFSEVLMMKDRRKAFGLWILIVVAMGGFAILDLLDLVQLNPKPLLLYNQIVGGVIFGVGMVLAGGCISGCLYKAATGNLNSIVALGTIPLGVMLVEFGPINAWHASMKQTVIKTSDGSVMSLPNISGLPFWLLAAAFGILTLAVMLFRRKRTARSDMSASGEAWMPRMLSRSWQPWTAGLAIGLLMVPAYLSSAASGRNYPLGVTHGVMQAELLLIDRDLNHVWQPKKASPAQSAEPAAGPTRKPVSWWLVGLVLTMVLGSWVSARMSGRAKLLPKPPGQMIVAIFGGLLTGAGAALATGCIVGNIMSGWALMSVGTFLFGLTAILANWATTYFYLIGRSSN